MSSESSARPLGSCFRSRVLPVLACALLSRVYLGFACYYAELDPFSPEQWLRWDSGNYLSIATHGYSVRETEYGFQGNTGWFPGYSWVVGAFAATGLNAHWAAVYLSFLFFVGMLLVLWNFVLKAELSFRNVLCLILATFFPGNVYYQAGFPISLFTLLVLILIICLSRERWVTAAAAGGGAAMAYTTGCLLAPVTTVWALLFHGASLLRRRKIIIFLPPLFVTAGFVVVLVVQDLSTGLFGSFFQVHRDMGLARYENPIKVFRLKTVAPLNPARIEQTWSRERFALRAANGRLVGIHAVKGTKELAAKYDKYKPLNAFMTTPLPDNKVLLRTAFYTSAPRPGHLFLSTGPDRKYPVLVRSGSVGPEETLTEVDLGEGRVAFRTTRGTYLGLDESARVVTKASSIGAAETFAKERSRDFFARFRGQVLAVQTLVVCFSFLVAVATLVLGRSRPASLHVLILLYAAVFFVFPLACGSNVAQFRAEALLFPLVVSLRGAGVVLLSLLALMYLALSFPMGVLFFQGVLV